MYEELRRAHSLVNRRLAIGDLESLLEYVDALKTVASQAEFLGDYLATARNEIANNAGGADTETLSARTIAYVIRNYHDPALGSQMIADALSMNPTYLLRVFKSETKISLHEYMNDYRAKMAAELLESTSLPIKEVRLRTGFTNDQNFFRVF
ncbi:MAG: AraC family transcriptional regulator [Spirochaetales bacterium]|nr:MAG: AraC family transcriptional regulator [Spirochaetales bacterium]